MKRGMFLLVSLIFILNFIILTKAQESSSIYSDFSILGCKTNSEYLPAQSCSRYGTFWCDKNRILWNVLRDKSQCAGTDSQYQTIDDCCPPNYFCDKTEQICVPRSYDCSELNQEDCETNGCVWWTDILPEKCIDKRQLTSCSDYKKNSTCTRDLFGLGKTTGIGTNICRGMYIGTLLVLIDSCKCKWQGINSTNGNCSLTYEIVGDNPELNAIFTCNKFFNVEECINGKQIISWTVYPESLNLDLTQQDLERFECIAGNKLVNCGNSFIKMPFFSFSQLLISIILISLIYIIKINYKKLK